MDDAFPFAAMHPTAGYLFAEELEIHFMTLDDLHSTLLMSDFPVVSTCTSPNSPSSVVYLPPYYPPSPCMASKQGEALRLSDDDAVFIKAEPLQSLGFNAKTAVNAATNSFIKPRPERNDGDSKSESERERLRCRQRGYEKRYRGRKRTDLKTLRDTWLALEMELNAARQKHCRPYVPSKPRRRTSTRVKMLELLREERALREDAIALRSLQCWEQISRIREYSDKDELRTVSEWRHSTEKIIGRCGMLGPQRFHPYAPMKQRHFTW